MLSATTADLEITNLGTYQHIHRLIGSLILGPPLGVVEPPSGSREG